MPSPDTSSSPAPRPPPLFDIAANVLLASGAVVLLVLPTNLFPVVLRVVPLLYAIALLGLRLWSLRLREFRQTSRPRIQECLQLAALLGILLTLVPAPLAATRVQGATRFSQNQRAELAVQDVQRLGLSDTVSQYGQGYALTRNRAGTVRVLLVLIAMHGA